MKILVPIKMSPFENPKVKTGLNLAKKTGAEVSFIHVVDTRPPGGTKFIKFPKTMTEHLKERGEKLLEDCIKEAEKEGIKIKTIHKEGHPFKEIMDALKSADLVIMRARAFSPSHKIGDITEKILEKSTIPVMLVEREQYKFEKCLIPMDGSKPSGKALEYLMQSAEKFGVKDILIIFVAKSPDREERGRAVLDNASQRAKKLEKSITPILRRGDPSREILKLSEEEDIDMIVMGTTGKGAMKRFFLGSVSREVAGSSIVPVILVP